MEIGATGARQDVGKSMQTLEEVKNDPDVKKMREKMETLQKETDRVDLTLKASRQERSRNDPDLYKECWEIATHAPKGWAMGLCMGTMFAGAALGVMATLAGMPQIAGVIALGSLVGTFYAVPRLYAGIMKKWVLPRKVDNLMQKRLKLERTGLENRLRGAKTDLEQAEKKSLSGLLEKQKSALPPQPDQAAGIEHEASSVKIGGVRLKKQRQGREK